MKDDKFQLLFEQKYVGRFDIESFLRHGVGAKLLSKKLEVAFGTSETLPEETLHWNFRRKPRKICNDEFSMEYI